MLRAIKLARAFRLCLAILLAVPILVGSSQKVFAAQVTNRKIVLSSNQISASPVTHTASFNYITAASTGSVVVQYCSNSPIIQFPCTAPAGLDTSAATLTSQTGETGFLVHPDTALASNKIIITRVPTIVTPQPSSYAFGNIINPSAVQTYFVRVTTHASLDGTGVHIDQGGMAFHTTDEYTISAAVPPRLEFCVGVSILGECDTATGNFINFGEFNTNSTAGGTSQFRANTNATNGYNVTISGTTMTSGNNTIPAMTTPSASVTGASQFGLNLRSNTIPPVGQDPAGPGNASPTSDYNSQNLFKYENGDTIATAPGTSDNKTFTVAYIVNVSNTQPAGIYNTSMSFICLATF